MSQDTRPLKRTRVDEDSSVASDSTTGTLQNLKRHDELWFDDGNIILIARDTAFRVYRGLLASQSTIFSDMLVSSSASADETFDGCPTVHLSDSPEDLTHFLRALLPGSQTRFYRRETDAMTALSFNAVSAVIRLAHKYHVADTQNQALLFLQDHCFTSDFDRYEERTKGSLHICYAHGIAGVNLARLTDTPSLLPDALLSCCILQGAIFDGWKREDGTVEHLSAEDLRRAHPSDNCDNPPRCSHSMDARCSCLVRQGTVFKYGPIIDWANVIRHTAKLSAICSECEKELQARNVRERRRFWEDLPKIFGITVDGWPSGGAGN